MLQGLHYMYSSQRHDTTKSDRVPMAMWNTCKKSVSNFPPLKCNYSVLSYQHAYEGKSVSNILPLHIYTERSYTRASGIRLRFYLKLFALFKSQFGLWYDDSM
jgi:hypothetical protein